MPIGRCKIQQAWLIVPSVGPDPVQPLNGAEHSLSEEGMAEAVLGWRAFWVDTQRLQRIEEEGECPLTVRAPLNHEEVLILNGAGELALDSVEVCEVAIVHKHQASVGERVAVALRQCASGCGTHMGKHQ